MSTLSAIAIAAHPDDIEFHMAGTLALLRRAGYETHYFSIASGNCGTTRYSSAATRRIRAAEAREGARILGAHFHPSITDDLEIVYSTKLLRKIAAVVRDARPVIVLTHSPQDYMEDHMNACRLAVTAAFAHGMPNFSTNPPRAAFDGEVTVYHSMPHGLCDGLRRRIIPGAFVNTTSVQVLKRSALAGHKSQQDWLDKSQRMDSFLSAMESMAREVGRLSGRFQFAEGFRRHSHLGLCAAQSDPLKEALGKNYLVNHTYERTLKKGL